MVKRTNIKDKKDKLKNRKKFDNRQKNTARFQLPKGAEIDYKNFALLQRYVNDRGRIVPRRISGVTAKEQRQLVVSIKRARHLALLISGSTRR